MTRVMLLAVLALSAGAAGALADDDEVLFDRKADKRLAEDLAEAVCKAAHPTGKSPGLTKHRVTRPKKDRVHWVLSVEYFGAITRNRYTADVTLKIDTSDGDFEVLDIDFKDLNNSVRPNEANLTALRRQINRKLEQAKKP